MKKKKEQTMNDFAGVGKQEYIPEEFIDTADLLWSEDDIKNFEDYNKNINKHNQEYIDLEPTRGSLLIRLFAKEVLVKDGIIMPNRASVGIPTASGIAAYQQIDDPYNFSKKGIIVAARDHSDYSPGDIVILRENLMLMPFGKGGNVAVILPDGFVHPDSNLDEMPQDPRSPHYGYVIKRESEINFKIK